MADKSVTELIFDKFEEFSKADAVLKDVSKELSDAVRKEKRKKEDISIILKKSG
jgi:hypothetical protein